MKNLLKFFFYYCAFVSLAITLLNLINLQPSSFLSTLLFLPITGYFLWVLIKNLRSRHLFDPEAIPTFNGALPTKIETYTILSIFALLTLTSLNRIHPFSPTAANPTPPLPTPSPPPSSPPSTSVPQPTPAPTPFTISISSPLTGTSFIRSQATSSATIISKVQHGDNYTVIAIDDHWYLLQISPYLSGWIHQNSTSHHP